MTRAENERTPAEPIPGMHADEEEQGTQHNQANPATQNKKRATIKIATFNANGGLDPSKDQLGAAYLIRDMANNKVDVATLQETYVNKQDREVDQEQHKEPAERGILYFLAGRGETGEHNYGQGFYVAPAWRAHYVQHKYVTNRLSYKIGRAHV